MKDIGAVFRQIRESRHISLEEATGGEFSRSMLSRFERGENDLTTQRFFLIFLVGELVALVQGLIMFQAHVFIVLFQQFGNKGVLVDFC